MVIEICPKCGKQYTLGENGIIQGCDACLKIDRDNQGRAWERDEKYQIFLNMGSNHEIIAFRSIAFRKCKENDERN